MAYCKLLHHALSCVCCNVLRVIIDSNAIYTLTLLSGILMTFLVCKQPSTSQFMNHAIQNMDLDFEYACILTF